MHSKNMSSEPVYYIQLLMYTLYMRVHMYCAYMYKHKGQQGTPAFRWKRQKWIVCNSFSEQL